MLNLRKQSHSYDQGKLSSDENEGCLGQGDTLLLQAIETLLNPIGETKREEYQLG